MRTSTTIRPQYLLIAIIIAVLAIWLTTFSADAGDGVWPGSTPTPNPYNYPTATPNPYNYPTATPVPAWNQPTSQPAAQPVGNGPYAGAPACPSHNPNVWHGLWDYERGCHYDHEHKHNPGVLYNGMPWYERAEAEAMLRVFGPPGEWFGGGSISYPWQTFAGSGEYFAEQAPGAHTENGHKHGGYGWLVRYNIPADNWQREWIRDFRLQFHAIMGTPGVLTQYHSYSLEANICSKDAGCRIIRTGGWIDFGHLIVNGGRIQLDGQVGDASRRRLFYTANSTERFAESQYQIPTFWYGSHLPPVSARPWDTERPFRRLVIGLASKDVWTNVRGYDPAFNDLFCPDFQCNKNGSTIQAHLLDINTLQDSFDGWTDRYGQTNPGCTWVSLDCIPTVIEPYSNGSDGKILLVFRDDRQLGYDALGQRDFDISPAGEWWIEFPN